MCPATFPRAGSRYFSYVGGEPLHRDCHRDRDTWGPAVLGSRRDHLARQRPQVLLVYAIIICASHKGTAAVEQSSRRDHLAGQLVLRRPHEYCTSIVQPTPTLHPLQHDSTQFTLPLVFKLLGLIISTLNGYVDKQHRNRICRCRFAQGTRRMNRRKLEVLQVLG